MYRETFSKGKVQFCLISRREKRAKSVQNNRSKQAHKSLCRNQLKSPLYMLLNYRPEQYSPRPKSRKKKKTKALLKEIELHHRPGNIINNGGNSHNLNNRLISLRLL